MIQVYQLIVLAFGIQQLYKAWNYYKQKDKKWAIACLSIGLFACVCSIAALTGIL